MVLYDYDAQTSEELSVNEGQTFNVYDDQSDPDWWWGSNGFGLGLVPATYLGRNDAVETPVAFHQEVFSYLLFVVVN